VKIIVILHTTLQRQTPDGVINRLEVDLAPGGILSGLLKQIGMQIDIENTLLVVNGHTAQLDMVLSEGDEVHLIPAISGGSS
jgi:molybdopterin converting factor small subunit